MASDLTIEPTTLLVLADGDTPSAAANARGRLFEIFAAKLLEGYGYEAPTQSHVNVTANGIELDVVTKTRLDGRPAIVECKAYARPVAAHELTNFYGKLTVRRFTDVDALGVMMVVPRLTADGEEMARAIADSDSRFIYMNVESVVEALVAERLVSPNPRVLPAESENAILLTEHGIFSAVLELDPVQRVPVRVIVWGVTGAVPTPVMQLLAAHEYAQGLDVEDARGGPEVLRPDSKDEVMVLVAVQASQGDFNTNSPQPQSSSWGEKFL